MPFQDLELLSFYEGWGDDISSSAIRPILKEAISYDRLSSYFSLGSLLSIADGIESIWKRGGKIRLIVGLHDIDSEILEAHREAASDNKASDFIELKNRLFRNLSRLEDEVLVDRVRVFATMLRDGLIEMKIASHPRGVNEAIFHNKRFIFRDSQGDLITGSSGMNETWMGLRKNFDELTLQRSWVDSGDQLSRHVESFERLWSSERPDLIVEELSLDFALELLEQIPRVREIQKPSDPNSTTLLRQLISQSGEYFFHSLEKVALFPHQERVLAEALSELPVRRLFADEVGLGKTLEAGATIKFLSQILGEKKIAIVCPQGLMRQWREEMSNHFDEDFWIWNSSSGTYESATSKKIKTEDGNPFGRDAPSKIVISAQLLRSKRYREMIENGADVAFDVFVLDESHAARTSIDAGGRIRRTRIWDVAKAIASASKHCLLLTATPIQMDVLELHGQLSILGLEDEWDDPRTFLESIQALVDLDRNSDLETCNLVGRLISSVQISQHHDIVGTEAGQLLEKIQGEDEIFNRALLVQKNADLSRELLIKLHPAHRMVIRNTRASLQNLGYKFPRRDFYAPELYAPDSLQSFFMKLDSYLRDTYGRVEKALHPSGKFNSGFAVSTYYQRVASSLHAAKTSLENRLSVIRGINEALISKRNFDLSVVQFSEDEEAVDILDSENFDLPSRFDSLSEKKANSALLAIGLEEFAIKELLASLNQVSDRPWMLDPKYAEAFEIVHRNKNKFPTLIYSRYTDTLDGFLKYFEMASNGPSAFGVGFYTGGQVWLEFDGLRLPADKGEVVKALFDQKISVLICSDAASEGLNLQAAGAIVNLDVPWNPARLEQRIGRIDRLGQDKETIEVHNLWYPNSVEAEIYKRLLARKETLELAVGRYPQLVSESIAEAVAERLGRTGSSGPSFELEQFRDRSQEEALNALMTLTGSETKSRRIRRDIFETLATEESTAQLVDKLQLNEGSYKTFTLLHPNLDSWWSATGFQNGDAEIFALTSYGRLLRFVLGSKKRLLLLGYEAIGDLIVSLVRQNPAGLSLAGFEESFESREELFSWLVAGGLPNRQFGALPLGDFALEKIL